MIRSHPAPRIASFLPAVLLGWIANSPAASAADDAPRESRAIVAGWRFQIDTHDLGEKDRWFAPGHDRSAWARAEVPRAWDTFDESLRGFEGIGWYAVTIDGLWAREGKLQRLAFGRVMYHSRVWLNGEFLGEHVDGYLPFALDVTGKLKGGANDLVLRVDNRPRIEWMPAAKQIEWVQYGGILQPVRLETRGKTAITELAIHGVPRGPGATVSCELEVASTEDAVRLVLRAAVEGVEGAARQVTLTAAAGRPSRHTLDLTLETAEPWSPDAPRMYTLVATLERDGRVVDRVSSPFGIRTIEARGRQLLLNGKLLKVRGVNRYDEYGRFGPNPPWPLVEDELKLMKRAGINLIRTHYPQNPEFLSLCDRVGILFLEELPINWWGIEWFGKEGVVQDERILDQAFPMLETMIRRDRNHPCVIIWSMANESRTDSEVGIKVMRTLLRRTRELDRTRLATFVTAPSSVRAHRAYEEADLVAFNMYPGSLGKPLADHLDQLEERAHRAAAENIRAQLAAFQDKPMIVTEYGAMGFPGLRGPVPGSEDFQAAYIKTIWQAIAGDPELSGGVLWSWADYHHRRNFLSLGAFGAFGVVTVDRRPKAALQALAEAYGGTVAR
jgi:beta-glucuronidase